MLVGAIFSAYNDFMSMKKPSIELVEHELTPGVFDLSHLPQFDESDAIVKRAHGNPGYFLDLDAGGSYDSAYWPVDHDSGDRNQRELLGYVVLGSIRTNTTKTLALQAIDRLRETLPTNQTAQSALDIVLDEVDEKGHQDRQSQACKMGETIVERLDFYHLATKVISGVLH